jgi:sortase (surface protein transpeptidase)
VPDTAPPRHRGGVRRGGPKLWAALAVAVLAVIGVILGVAVNRSPKHHSAGAAAGSSHAQAAGATGPSVQTPVPPAKPTAGAALPARVAVPRLGIASDLQRLHLRSNGELQSPSKWQEAGWYADGTRPGDVGPAIIAGHVDSTEGPAIFYRLRQMRPGDKILVTEATGRVLTFVVSQVKTYPKDKFPTNTVYGPTPLPSLRLVTCTGDFDLAHHNYLDNLVVFAELAVTRVS